MTSCNVLFHFFSKSAGRSPASQRSDHLFRQEDDRSRAPPKKGQRGEASERLVEMNVRWQANMKTLRRRLTASAGLQRRLIVGFAGVCVTFARSASEKGLN